MPAPRRSLDQSDPFLLDGQACISFSGGRSSAFMLYRIIEAHGGKLPPDVVVCFANTGKEMPETLDFVRDCGERWGVDIVWLEYRAKAADGSKQFERVTYETASRAGEPYEALIHDRRFLPNPVSRFCTVELKIRVMHRHLRSIGWSEWYQAIGIRADEGRRLAKMRARGRSTEGAFETPVSPLADAGITRAHIGAFWAAQPFDLRLQNDNGTTPLGNCDLCFLKGQTRIASILRERPELGEWWARMEDVAAADFGVRGQGDRFRSDRPRYRALIQQVKDQQLIQFDEPLSDCFCVD